MQTVLNSFTLILTSLMLCAVTSCGHIETRPDSKHWENSRILFNPSSQQKIKVTYSLREIEEGFEGTINLKELEGRNLWEHTWHTNDDDMTDLLLQSGYINPENWVENIFSPENPYGVNSEVRNIKADEIDMQLAGAGIAMDGQKAKKMQSIKEIAHSNTRFFCLYYRAEWREALVELMFVPAPVNRFVQYGKGDY